MFCGVYEFLLSFYLKEGEEWSWWHSGIDDVYLPEINTYIPQIVSL